MPYGQLLAGAANARLPMQLADQRFEQRDELQELRARHEAELKETEALGTLAVERLEKEADAARACAAQWRQQLETAQQVQQSYGLIG